MHLVHFVSRYLPPSYAACSFLGRPSCASRSARRSAPWKWAFRLRKFQVDHYSATHLTLDNPVRMSPCACRVTAPWLEPTRVSKACRRRISQSVVLSSSTGILGNRRDYHLALRSMGTDAKECLELAYTADVGSDRQVEQGIELFIWVTCSSSRVKAQTRTSLGVTTSVNYMY